VGLGPHAPWRLYVLTNRIQRRAGAYIGVVIRVGLVMEPTLEQHVARIQRRLADGRRLLRSLREDQFSVYDIPDVVPDLTFTNSSPPLDTDRRVPFPSPPNLV
jgi:hypothetical protein